MAIQCQCGMAALVILWSHLSTGLLPKVPFTANTFVLICVFPRVQLLITYILITYKYVLCRMRRDTKFIHNSRGLGDSTPCSQIISDEKTGT